MGICRIAIPVLPGTRPQNYLDALAALGAQGIPTDAREVCAACDGLLLPGGGDVDPALYGQPNRASEDIDRALDELQLGALEDFVRSRKPVLGICRGHQVLNVYFGGTLNQHLPTFTIHDWDADTKADKAHATRALAGSVVQRIYGDTFAVNSAHHQAVDALGDGLRITQWSEDGVVEAVEHRALPVWGVQWHPERMCLRHARADTVDGSGIIGGFLERCRGH